jgi:hypothetical protein
LYYKDDTTLEVDRSQRLSVKQWLAYAIQHLDKQSDEFSRFVINIRLSVAQKYKGPEVEAHNITVTFDTNTQTVTFFDPNNLDYVREFLTGNLQYVFSNFMRDVTEEMPFFQQLSFNYNGILNPIDKAVCFTLTPFLFILESILEDSNKVSDAINGPMENGSFKTVFAVVLSQKLHEFNKKLLETAQTCTNSFQKTFDNGLVQLCNIDELEKDIRKLLHLVDVMPKS